MQYQCTVLLAQGTRLVKTPILDTPTTCLSVIMELEAVVPSRSRRRTAYNVKYTVTRFELLDFVNRERGRDRVYICGRSGEYFVTYPARHLFFIHVLILQPVLYGTMLYFSCDMIVFKLYTNLSIDQLYLTFRHNC